MYSMDPTGNDLSKLLKNTDVLKVKHRCLLYAIRSEHFPPLFEALKYHGVKEEKCVLLKMYWISKEKAINDKIE